MKTIFLIKDESQKKGIKVLKEYKTQIHVYPGLQVTMDDVIYKVRAVFLSLTKDGQCAELVEE